MQPEDRRNRLQIEPPGERATEVIDLETPDVIAAEEDRVKDEPELEHITSSSSTESSSEEFQEGKKRSFEAPKPPDGHVFWQHKKLKTLHLTRPECFRVFLCGRPVGKFHSREDMTIRYDTPVCRLCMSHATEEWGA